MARAINRLSARAVATIAKRGRYADGGGLYLQVSAFDTKAWIFRYTLNGKSREMGLGSLRTVSLAEARVTARECRKQIRERIDPIEQRKLLRAQAAVDVATAKTFRFCAESFIASHEDSWRNSKHRAQWRSTLATYVYPVFGDVPVHAIDTAMVTRTIEPIWTTKTETATRLRGRIEAVLDWAKARGYRSGENPARWRGHLENLLPKPSKVSKIRHHAALPYDEMGAFMVKLRERGAIAARGLEFLILTATRTSEVLGARWDEIDFARKVWTVPADRMKSEKEHRIPLASDALSVLQTMSEVRQSDFIFPGSRRNRPLSNTAFSKLLDRMGRGDVTTHGFRSSFTDWAAECTAAPNEVAKMALAHTVSDAVEAAYRRGDMLVKRQRLMDDWATFCAQPPTDRSETVVPIGKRR